MERPAADFNRKGRIGAELPKKNSSFLLSSLMLGKLKKYYSFSIHTENNSSVFLKPKCLQKGKVLGEAKFFFPLQQIFPPDWPAGHYKQSPVGRVGSGRSGAGVAAGAPTPLGHFSLELVQEGGTRACWGLEGTVAWNVIFASSNPSCIDSQDINKFFMLSIINRDSQIFKTAIHKWYNFTKVKSISLRPEN